jgi:hypothetical protein
MLTVPWNNIHVVLCSPHNDLKPIKLISPQIIIIISQYTAVLEMKIWIYWIDLNIVLNKSWKIYWSKQSFTDLGPEDRSSLWGLHSTTCINVHTKALEGSILCNLALPTVLITNAAYNSCCWAGVSFIYYWHGSLDIFAIENYSS